MRDFICGYISTIAALNLSVIKLKNTNKLHLTQQLIQSIQTKMSHFDVAKKVWFGPKDDFHIDKHSNFGEIILEKLADDDSNRVMQIDSDTGETLTKAEARKRTIRCAQHLLKLGCTPSDCIGIVARNHHSLTPLLYAALCIGVPVTPLDVVIVKDGIVDIFQRIRPSFIFCDSDILDSIKDVINDIELDAKVFTVNESVDGFDSINVLMNETGNEDSFVCTKINDAFSHIALIACSSGSTGRAKSIAWSHANFHYTFIKTFIECDLVTLSFSSLYWFTGIMTTINAAFKTTRVFSKQPFSAGLFLDTIANYKVQRFFGTPRQVYLALKSEQSQIADLSSLQQCILVGAQISHSLVNTMKQIIPNCAHITRYGATEIGGMTRTIGNELEQYPGTVGRLSSNVQMKLINENTGERCGVGEKGEIFVKVLVPSMGYYKDKTANRNAFDDEGYFITGDLGYFDESGRLYIDGRKNEFFKSRDFAISPVEIENILLEHSAIRLACVVSIYDDELMTNLPAAVIVKMEQHTITENEVYSLISDRLPSYKNLDGGIYFVDDLPVTPSDKVARTKVREMAQQLYHRQKPGN